MKQMPMLGEALQQLRAAVVVTGPRNRGSQPGPRRRRYSRQHKEGLNSVFDLLATHTERGLAMLTDPQHATAHWLAFGSAAVAGALVIVSAFVRTMIPLRWLAVGSNVGFIVYGLVHPSLLMVLLHGVLLPVNLWRVGQMVRLTRRVSAVAADSRQIGIWLRPYMRSRTHRAGTRLFERGALADRMYLLADGVVELPDVGGRLEAGQMFGEIAFFAPDGRRSSSAVCATACTVLSIDRDTFLQLIHQNPDFGLEVLRLVTARLSQDVQRLQRVQLPR
jgi:CRP/FNR family transcriptional regulator, cyclic AMP receptor protein